MAVPNTNKFSLNDVRVQLGLASNTSLTACFGAAVDSRFDPNHRGSKNSLLNFRNYGANLGVATSPISLGRSLNQQQVCSSPREIYHISGISRFAEAFELFTNSNGTTKAPASYYSDGSIFRYWNGNLFTGGSFCTSNGI